MAPPPGPNVDLVLEEIKNFKGRGRLRPTKTVDKSKPILLAEGESLKSYIPKENEVNLDVPMQITRAPPAAPPAPPPLPPPMKSLGKVTLPFAPPAPPLPRETNLNRPPPAAAFGKNSAVGFKKSQKSGGNFDRDKLMKDIKDGVRLRRTVTNDRSDAASGGKVLDANISRNQDQTHEDSGYNYDQSQSSDRVDKQSEIQATNNHHNYRNHQTPASPTSRQTTVNVQMHSLANNSNNQSIQRPINESRMASRKYSAEQESYRPPLKNIPVAPPLPPQLPSPSRMASRKFSYTSDEESQYRQFTPSAPPPPPEVRRNSDYHKGGSVRSVRSVESFTSSGYMPPPPPPPNYATLPSRNIYDQEPQYNMEEEETFPPAPGLSVTQAELEAMSNRQLVAELRQQSEMRFLQDQNNRSQRPPQYVSSPSLNHVLDDVQTHDSNGFSVNQQMGPRRGSAKNLVARFEETINEMSDRRPPKVVSIKTARKAQSEEPNPKVQEIHQTLRSYSVPVEEPNFRDYDNGIVSQMLARLQQTPNQEQNVQELTTAIAAADENFGSYIETQELKQYRDFQKRLALIQEQRQSLSSSQSSPSLPLPPEPINSHINTETTDVPFKSSGFLPSVSALKQSFENAHKITNTTRNNYYPIFESQSSMRRPENGTNRAKSQNMNSITPATSESGFHDDDHSSIISDGNCHLPVQGSYRPAYEELTILPKVDALKRNYEAKLHDKHQYTSSGGSMSSAETGSSDGDITPYNHRQNNYNNLSPERHTNGNAVISMRPNEPRLDSQSMPILTKSEAKAKINAVLALSVDTNANRARPDTRNTTTPINYHAQPINVGEDSLYRQNDVTSVFTNKAIVNESRLEYVPVDDIRANYIFHIDPETNQVLGMVPR